MNSGDKLGPYEIVALIGKGGMGEVYRAHDPRLGRDVAIKVSAARFSERFEREARAVAALNHPNICTLYDVGPNYLVMEYIEGESPKGPMPLDEALRIARQIADALEAAHAKPIIHRDLKPANIKIKPDGLVKVLDFGLAKMYEPPGEDGDTIPLGKTEDGTILGTPAYMSPEQALGKKADKRADIWAFGVVLYELLTGERPFKGKEVGDILESVVKKEPDLELAPPQARRLLKKCLEKDATRRLNSARDMDLLLEDAPIGEPQAAALRPWLGWAAAGLFLIAATLVSLLHFREQPPIAPEPVRFQIPLPDQTSFSSDEPMPFAISPDGRKVAFTLLSSDGVKQLWIRALDEVQAQPLSNGQIASASWPALFWSPDSRFVAFDSGDKLYKIDVSGGAPQPVCDLPGRILGGSWNRDGVIVFGTIAGVKRVSASGGATATPLTVVDRSRGEVQHWYPTFLPDQRHFLYLRRAAKAGNMGVYLGSIDAQPRDQSLKMLAPTPSSPLFVPSAGSATGQLLFLRGQTLLAQTFDLRRMDVTGEAVPVAEQIQIVPFAEFGYFSASSGVLIYKTAPELVSQLTWFDRQGKILGTAGEPGFYRTLALSPDGTRVAVQRGPQSRDSDIWLLDLAHGGSSRFTFSAGQHRYPAWSPDGTQVWFGSGNRIYRKAANGAGDEEPLFAGHADVRPSSWSHDGRFLLYHDLYTGAGADLWLCHLGADDKPVPFAGAGVVGMGRFSPDSRWIAYTSNESGVPEVYVRPFDPSSQSGLPPNGGKWLVSRGGGQSPRWRGDSKELFYLAPGGNVMSVEVAANPAAFQASEPKLLFKSASGSVEWDAAPDGKRFLLPVPVAQGGREEFSVILNWQAGLKK